ncbi:MAG TPA: DUF6660 family protein [Myxococcota bacterium]|nr:DUF6660 family protein [Myxococcota bacterium]
MKLQRLALAVLFLFVAGLVSATAGEILLTLVSSDRVNCSEGPSCPDPDDDGNPCGPTCPCACCPGHSAAAAFVSIRPSIQALPSDEFQASLTDDLHPKDFHFRIFHPPRA